MPDDIRLAVVDDHQLYLTGIERTFTRVAGVRLVATGGTMQEAIDICDRVQPDVLLLDIGIPGGGLNALRQIRSKHPSVNVTMLTGSDDDEHMVEALANGARGYLLKGANAAELRDAVLKVAAGDTIVDPGTATRLFLKQCREVPRQTEKPAIAKLNSQEGRIFELMSEGLTNAEIAERLELSVSTVRNYVTSILRKLNARNRLMAVSNRGTCGAERPSR